MKRRFISLLLVVVMLASMMPALGITINAEATDPMSEGMTFTSGAYNRVSKAYTEAPRTMEATIYVPEGSAGGVRCSY